MKRKITLFLLLCAATATLFAVSPKREMRSTWTATVWRIDWPNVTIPSTGNLGAINNQKNQMIRILDSLQNNKLNAIFFQVRSQCDALYESAYEPWSSDIVANRGMVPGYDPLAFTVEECHKRGIECHAWLNPYRYRSSSTTGWTGSNAWPDDYQNTHPDWLLTYKDGMILDPANPEVRQRIADVVVDIISKYDVDGIVFDDYFYPYGGTSNEDAASVAKWKPADQNVGDWRRENVNKMVAQVYNTIQAKKPWVRFGLSPFGTWSSDATNYQREGLPFPVGAGGTGNMYAEIFCDPLAWIKEGTIDYISPQLYWKIGAKAGDYLSLTEWWSNLVVPYGVHFFSSMSLSDNSAEVKQELDANRNYSKDNAPGSVFWSLKSWAYNKQIIEKIRSSFTHRALVPAMDWKKHSTPGLVKNIAVSGSSVTWTSVGSSYRYTVYAIPNAKVNTKNVLNDAQYLLGVTYTNSFSIPSGVSSSTHKFAVAPLDRYGNEFPATIQGVDEKTAVKVTLLSPATGAELFSPIIFTWQPHNDAEVYFLEIAEDNRFNKIVLVKETTKTQVSTAEIKAIGGKNYFWRVRARRTAAPDGYSEVRSINWKEFVISAPATKSKDVSLTPTIQWYAHSQASEFSLLISSTDQMKDSVVFQKFSAGTNSYAIPQYKLAGLVTYYVYVEAKIGNETRKTPVINFTTEKSIPAVPNFTFPTNGSTVSAPNLRVAWTEGTGKTYRVELSTTNTFPARSSKIKTVSSGSFEAVYEGLADGKWFARVRATYNDPANQDGEWSPVIQFEYKKTTPVANTSADLFNCFAINGNNEVRLVVDAIEGSSVRVSLIDLSGRTVSSDFGNFAISAGHNEFLLPTNQLNGGMYLLSLDFGKEKRVIKLIAK